MKKLLLSFLLISGLATVGYGQTIWNYDFGTGASTSYSTNAISTSFLPAPQSNGGSAMVRVGSGGGSIKLTNPGDINTTGTGASIVAPTNSSVNKLSIYGFNSSSSTATIKFKIKFNASDATWYMFTGKGNSFSDVNGFASADVFSGLRIVVSGGVATTSNRIASSWSTSSGIPSTSTFTPNNVYEIELYLNNKSVGTSSYTRNNVTYNVNPDKYDIWVNGASVATNITTGGIAADAFIDSFMFYGETSAGNAGELFIDDFSYTNIIVPTTLPVALNAFKAKASLQQVDLTWNTAAETNNARFEILRSADGKTFSKIDEVNGAGNSTENRNYAYTDKDPLPGVNYYKLKQVDFDGQHSFSEVQAVKSNVVASNFKVAANKQNGTVKLTVYVASDSKATFKIYDLNGRKLAEQELNLSKGYSNVSVPFNGGNGLHIASLTTATETLTQKFIQ